MAATFMRRVSLIWLQKHPVLQGQQTCRAAAPVPGPTHSNTGAARQTPTLRTAPMTLSVYGLRVSDVAVAATVRPLIVPTAKFPTGRIVLLLY
jgi:hypothetical protein